MQRNYICQDCGCLLPTPETQKEFPHKCLIQDPQPLSQEQIKQIKNIVIDILLQNTDKDENPQ